MGEAQQLTHARLASFRATVRVRDTSSVKVPTPTLRIEFQSGFKKIHWAAVGRPPTIGESKGQSLLGFRDGAFEVEFDQSVSTNRASGAIGAPSGRPETLQDAAAFRGRH